MVFPYKMQPLLVKHQVPVTILWCECVIGSVENMQDSNRKETSWQKEWDS